MIQTDKNAVSAGASPLQSTAKEIADHMSEILALFKPGMKITIMVRDPDASDLSLAFVLTNDKIEEAVKAFELRKLAKGAQNGAVYGYEQL